MNAGIIAVIIVVLALAGVFVPLFFWAKRRSKVVQAVIRQVEEELGLVNQSPRSTGSFPNLRGMVDGVEIAVDVYHQRYASSKSTASTRPWTRVRAQLSEKPHFQVRTRNRRYAEKMRLSARETGNAAFDEKYVLFLSETASPAEALPPALMDALIAADPPVDVLNKAVVWMQKGMVSDAMVLKNAVRACARVASVIENR